MELKVSLVRRILKMLSDKTGHPLDHSGLRMISEKIFGIGKDRYLYHNVVQKIKAYGDSDSVGFSQYHLEAIATFLGYDSLQNLQSTLSQKPDPILESLYGNYYCYVRASHQEGKVLRSPVSIVPENGKAWLRLQGKNYVFEGEAKLHQGCLFILMESAEGKSFYHVYKIGTRKSPEVLQGVFAGVSTAFDPIAGRTVLVRQDAPPGSLSNEKISINQLERSSSTTEQLLARYFRDFSKNNLSPNKSIGFSQEDLEEI
jgi:hypothetical protein